MNKTLYISDLDGTLLNKEALISDKSLQILNDLIERGALFSIATARTPATVAGITKNLNINLPIVVMTGAALWHRESNTYSDVQHFSHGTPQLLLNIYRRHNVPTFLFLLQNNHLEIYHQGELSGFQKQFVLDRINSPYKSFHIPEDGNSIFPENLDDAVLFYAMYPDPAVKRLFAETSKVPDINPLYYHDFYGPEIGIAEAFPKGATKALAIRRLAKNCNADRIVAFGDNLNDIPMLKAADLAVAVDNALPEVKEIADIIIPANTENSVAEFIKQDFLNL